MNDYRWLQLFATDEEKKVASEATTATTATDTATTGSTATTPSIYGGSYDSQISDLYTQITNRTPFNYDVNGDALYQQYKDQYTKNAKKSMQDTMGQAASLTGGYGSSYSQAAGQQAYDETMTGLTDIIPTLEENAYGKYQDQGTALQNQYSMLTDLGAQEQTTKNNNYNQMSALISSYGYTPTDDELASAGMTRDAADALKAQFDLSNQQTKNTIRQQEQSITQGDQTIKSNDYNYLASIISSTGYSPTDEELAAAGMSRDAANSLISQYSMTNQSNQYSLQEQAQSLKNNAYSRLASSIQSTGYTPTTDELTEAGMTENEANALRQSWIVANPLLAYRNGAITGDEYYVITGEYPIGYTPAVVSSGGGGYDYSGTTGTPTGDTTTSGSGLNTAQKTQIDSALISAKSGNVSYAQVESAIRNASDLSSAQKQTALEYTEKKLGF